jgi:hypothetical protein
MSVPEEPVCIDLFRQNPVFTSLHLKSPVHVVPPLAYKNCLSLGEKDVEDDGKAEYLHEVGEEELKDGPEDARRHENMHAHPRHPGQPVHKLVPAAVQEMVLYSGRGKY